MALIRRPTPTDMPPHPRSIPVTFIAHEDCPCGARYTSSFNRDPVVWGAWVTAHRECGFQEEND